MDFAEDFWIEANADTVLGDGTVGTVLDARADALCAEVRYAIYYVSTFQGPRH